MDSFAEAGRAAYTIEADALVLAFSGDGQNVHDDLPNIEAALRGTVDPLIRDLYRIALVVYLWDIRTERSDKPRNLHALLSVSNKDRWDTLAPHLEATLRFLTGDTYTFEFVQGEPAHSESAVTRVDGGCVLLFSGGLDSLAGIRWAIQNGINPILVSHPGASIISDAQKDILARLNQLLGRTLQWHQVRATAERGKELQGIVPTQFSRSFLYLALGTLFAFQLGIDRLLICENGLLALNIPLTQARIYDSTRTVQPKFLMMYQRLLDTLFRATRIQVQNPFLNYTKGEVVALLNADGYRDIVPITISCSEVQRLWRKGVKISDVRHCGICLPCVVRRIAIHHAGIGLDARYVENIEAEYATIPEDGRKLLFEMAEFYRMMKGFKTIFEALSEVNEFMVEDYDTGKLFDMTQRQLAQFKKYVDDKMHASVRDNLGLG